MRFIAVVCLVVMSGCGWVSEGGQVARKEFGPKGALKKYEWFKDASAQLDAKKANIAALKTRIESMEKRYVNRDMPRVTEEQYNLWQQELAGVKAGYNSLVAEYNAASSKFNWTFVKGQDSVPHTYTEEQ